MGFAPLTRGELLNLGKCCGSGCINCPYPLDAPQVAKNAATVPPFRHFCGGSSIKLPLDKADFRRQWVRVGYPTANGGKFTVGRYEDVWVEFPTCENSVSL